MEQLQIFDIDNILSTAPKQTYEDINQFWLLTENDVPKYENQYNIEFNPPINFIRTLSNTSVHNTRVRYAEKITPTSIMCQSKLLINLDWLTLRFSSPSIDTIMFDENNTLEVGNFRLVLESYGTRFYKHVASVMYKFENEFKPIAVLEFAPTMRNMNNTSMFKIVNYVFYDKFFRSNIRTVISDYMDTFHCSMLSISRVDICVDGVDFAPFESNLRENAICRLIRGQKPNESIDLRSFDIENDVFTQFYIGSRKSRYKFIRYYNKSKEIRDNGDKKSYINKYFKNNGFDMEKDTNRFEIQLNADYLRTIENLDWTKLFDYAYLTSIFKKSLEGFFDFVHVGTDTNMSRCERVEFFDWSKFETEKIELFEVDPCKYDGVASAKVMVKKLVGFAVTQKDSELRFFNMKIACDVCNRFDIWGWLYSRSHIWIKEFLQSCNRLGVKPCLDFYATDVNHDTGETFVVIQQNVKVFRNMTEILRDYEFLTV